VTLALLVLSRDTPRAVDSRLFQLRLGKFETVHGSKSSRHTCAVTGDATRSPGSTDSTRRACCFPGCERLHPHFYPQGPRRHPNPKGSQPLAGCCNHPPIISHSPPREIEPFVSSLHLLLASYRDLHRIATPPRPSKIPATGPKSRVEIATPLLYTYHHRERKKKGHHTTSPRYLCSCSSWPKLPILQRLVRTPAIGCPLRRSGQVWSPLSLGER
jgi:hypothetical protein